MSFWTGCLDECVVGLNHQVSIQPFQGGAELTYQKEHGPNKNPALVRPARGLFFKGIGEMG